MKTNRKGMTVVVLLTAVFALSTLMGEEKPEAAAQKSAESWLAVVDAGSYGESWEQMSTAAKSQVTKEQWVGALQQNRQPLGKMQSRKLASAQYSENPPNAPAGKYVVIQYQTAFEKMPSITETIVPMLDKDGQWRVSGYWVKVSDAK